MCRSKQVTVVVLSLLGVACGGDVATEPHRTRPGADVAASRGVEFAVPIAGRCVSADAQPPVVSFPFIDQVITGTCEFSHLGRTSMSLLQHVDLRTGSVGQLTLTAANGDALQITQSAVATDVGPSVRTFVGVATVVGGTGRFASATGTLTLNGTLTFDQTGIGHAVSTYDGSIAYRKEPVR